jgi:hypothetical protein
MTRVIHFVNDTGENLTKGCFVGKWDNSPVNTDTIIILKTICSNILLVKYIYGKCIYGISPQYGTTNISWKGCLSDWSQGYRELVCILNDAQYTVCKIFLNKDNTINISAEDNGYFHRYTGKKIYN